MKEDVRRAAELLERIGRNARALSLSQCYGHLTRQDALDAAVLAAILKKDEAGEWRGKCPHCEGEGVAHSDGGWIDCPDCNGTGEAQP